MSEKITNAIILSSALFGSIFLFEMSLKRFTEQHRIQARPLRLLDGFIVGITGYFIVRVNIKAFNIYLKNTS